MKHFTQAADVADIQFLVKEAIALKQDPFSYQKLGRNKTLGLIFFNPSLRTRISTQIAARNLGMEVIVMNINQDGWKLEMQDGSIMDGDTSEHIKDALGVLGRYCHLLGVRAFPGLTDQKADYQETVLSQFLKYSPAPVISLESAIRHPLQSLADLITMREHHPIHGQRPKVVLTWAPHPKALPQAVANSFAEWIAPQDYNFVVTHPKGYELHPNFAKDITTTTTQDRALEGADFVYVKNWSSYQQYGQVLCHDKSWMLTLEHLKNTRNAKVMHCLPVRRNVVIADEVLDSPQSIVLDQAENRIYAAQVVLKELLEKL